MNNKRISNIMNKLQKVSSPKEIEILNSDQSQIKRGSTIGFLKFQGFGMSEIIKNFLYLSGQDIATNLEQLEKYKITHILNLTSNVENIFESKIKYKRFKIYDSLEQSISGYFQESFNFIEDCFNSDGRILVHCNAGVSRSVSIVIGYLMYKKYFNSYESAYLHVKKCRPVIQPNPSFIKQLKDFQENNSNLILSSKI